VCVLLSGCCAKKRVAGAYRVGLTRRGGQRYAVGLPEVGRWFLGRDAAATEFRESQHLQ